MRAIAVHTIWTISLPTDTDMMTGMREDECSAQHQDLTDVTIVLRTARIEMKIIWRPRRRHTVFFLASL